MEKTEAKLAITKYLQQEQLNEDELAVLKKILSMPFLFTDMTESIKDKIANTTIDTYKQEVLQAILDTIDVGYRIRFGE